MKDLNPDELLKRLTSEADGELKADALKVGIIQHLYEHLDKTLFVRAYDMFVQELVDADDPDVSVADILEEMPDIARVFTTIADVENISLIDAGKKYFEEMDLIFPDFSKVREMARVLDIAGIHKMMDASGDPFRKWQGTDRDSLKSRSEVKKLMAALGWQIVSDTIKEDQEFYKAIQEEFEGKKYLIGANIYSSFYGMRKAKKMLKHALGISDD